MGWVLTEYFIFIEIGFCTSVLNIDIKNNLCISHFYDHAQNQWVCMQARLNLQATYMQATEIKIMADS